MYTSLVIYGCFIFNCILFLLIGKHLPTFNWWFFGVQGGVVFAYSLEFYFKYIDKINSYLCSKFGHKLVDIEHEELNYCQRCETFICKNGL